jgi:hypothetical protein
MPRSLGSNGRRFNQAKAGGIPVAEPEAVGRLKLANAVEEYLTTGKALRKNWRPKTIKAYSRSLRLFTDSYKRVYFDDIGRKDVLGFIRHLRTVENKWGKRFSDRAVYNNFMNVLTFLNEYSSMLLTVARRT